MTDQDISDALERLGELLYKANWIECAAISVERSNVRFTPLGKLRFDALAEIIKPFLESAAKREGQLTKDDGIQIAIRWLPILSELERTLTQAEFSLLVQWFVADAFGFVAHSTRSTGAK